LEKADLLAATSNPVALERTGFTGTSLPSGWVASGAWTVSNGLTPPAAGGWGVKALNGTYSSIVKRSQYWRIKINSTDTIAGLAASPPENSGGAALLIDGVAGKLRLYSWDDTGAAGTLRSETALPAALTVGREYILKLDKDGFNLTGTFKDTVTQASCTVTLDGAATYTMALGKCGALFISATTVPNFQWMEYLAPYPRKCRALIIGDSIGEGAYLGSASPTWMAQIATARSTQNDIVIAARAGDESPNFIGRKAFDWDIWLPQFAVIAMGTNDTNQSDWRMNVGALISKAVSLGAEPILCTQVPRTASQALRTAMNIDIRTGYFGRYRYIDMAIPVSSGNLGVAWSATYDFGDGVHPNAAGQNLMYAQAQIEAPYLFA
jgi:lysophospholipase L1-like esterase